MWNLLGFKGKNWRDALRFLVEGTTVSGRHLPGLDIPRRYAAAVNRFVGDTVFWCPIARTAKLYRIPRTPPRWHSHADLRVTEGCGFPVASPVRPKPANAVGGRGVGVVGGQTICGLRFLDELAADPRVAFWPFDGLSVSEERYGSRHVAVEIYPSGLRPRKVVQTDTNDALYSCAWVQEQDRLGMLASWLDVTHLKPGIRNTVLVEGWIVGATQIRSTFVDSIELKPTEPVLTRSSGECHCCLRGAPFTLPRRCPECGHRFQRGWIGIDAHWKSRHSRVLPYDRFWSGLCAGHRR